MRLRNISGSREAIAESPYVIHEPEKYKGNWKQLFGNDYPVRIEIGMGKGRFIMDLARKNPEINYLGIEKYSSVLLRGIQKMELDPMPNLYFIRMEAEEIVDVFGRGEIDRIYLNFSDPWPKDRHAKRRLPSREFLSRYNEILKKDGIIEFKTDNRNLFEFSLKEIPDSGWNLDAYTLDLHHDSSMNQGNIMTEYEQKFSSMGNPIYKLIASP